MSQMFFEYDDADIPFIDDNAVSEVSQMFLKNPLPMFYQTGSGFEVRMFFKIKNFCVTLSIISIFY